MLLLISRVRQLVAQTLGQRVNIAGAGLLHVVFPFEGPVTKVLRPLRQPCVDLAHCSAAIRSLLNAEVI